MAKKKYQQPSFQICYVQSAEILSGSTGATGGDVPWGVKRCFSPYNDFEEEDYDY